MAWINGHSVAYWMAGIHGDKLNKWNESLKWNDSYRREWRPPEEELHGSTTTREATECIPALSENHAHIYFPQAIPLSMAW